MRRLAIVGAVVFIGALALSAPFRADSLTADHTDCKFCHLIHGSSGYAALLNAATAEAVCLSCHGPGGSSPLKGDVHTNTKNSSYAAFSFTCKDCHDSHSNRDNWQGGTNIKLIGRDNVGDTRLFANAVINTPNSGIMNVTFESRGSNNAGEPTLHSFADGNEDGVDGYDGVCEVCHTLTGHHRNDDSGGDHTHHVGETCTRCHAHTDFFRP